MPTQGPQSGSTLLEFMVSAALFAVLGTLAVPAFSNMLNDSMRSTAVNAFIHTIFLARSEAMKRGQTVSICKSDDGSHCNNRGLDWNTGWIAFENLDHDEPPVRDAGEPVLSVEAAWPRGHITANRKGFSFQPHSRGLANGTVVFCDPRGSASARAVIISKTGRPRVAQRDGSNHPLVCPRG